LPSRVNAMKHFFEDNGTEFIFEKIFHLGQALFLPLCSPYFQDGVTNPIPLYKNSSALLH
jgi:hypothetical protein